MANNSSSGMSVLSLLGVVFITLKLCKVIDWSWGWVTSPFWGLIAIAVFIFLAAFIISWINENIIS